MVGFVPRSMRSAIFSSTRLSPMPKSLSTRETMISRMPIFCRR